VKESASTNPPLGRTGSLSLPPDTYKPRKGLQDLAQLLSAGPYSEEIPPATEKPNPTARLTKPVSPDPSPSRSVLNGQPDTREQAVQRPRVDNSGEIAMSMLEQVAQTLPERDVESLLEALSRSLAEEYKRFYGG
jgi:hypothetical protein